MDKNKLYVLIIELYNYKSIQNEYDSPWSQHYYTILYCTRFRFVCKVNWQFSKRYRNLSGNIEQALRNELRTGNRISNFFPRFSFTMLNIPEDAPTTGNETWTFALQDTVFFLKLSWNLRWKTRLKRTDHCVSQWNSTL